MFIVDQHETIENIEELNFKISQEFMLVSSNSINIDIKDTLQKYKVNK